MKLRLGFVSNSSSSSFVAWGIRVDKEDLIKVVKENHTDEINCDPDDVGRYDLAEIVLENTALDYHIVEYADDICAGMCPFQMKPNQTLFEYKQEIVAEFKKVGITVTTDEIHSIEECSYDG